VLLLVAWPPAARVGHFLVTRRPPGGAKSSECAARANELTCGERFCRRRAVATEADSGRTPLRLLLTPTTVLVWVTFFCTMAAFYFIVSWTPRLAERRGLLDGPPRELTGGRIG